MSDMLSGLMAALEKQIPKESIDGHDPREVARCVMLDVAFTPVLERFVNEERLMFDPPEPVEVQQDGERYMLVKPREHDFRWIDSKSLAVMRARFLLVRGYYYPRLRVLDYQTRDRVLCWYFPGGVYMPAEGSALSKALGIIESMDAPATTASTTEKGQDVPRCQRGW